jgi:uncharacterized protein YqjF (DUF2071 family)
MHTFLTAEWRKLILAQYEVAPSALAPWLPNGLELDLYDDHGQPKCYVSLVGFLFDNVRVKGIAFPFHTRFEEVNLRFYVARNAPDGTRRRGVVFIREFVPRAAISLIARSLYEEPYRTLPMRHRIESTSESLHVEYAWRARGRWSRLAVDADPQPEQIAPGSVEEFITEHYWGYTRRTRGHTSEYGVQHPRWSIYRIRNSAVEADLGALYGSAFASLHAAAPANIVLAEGSDVSVSSGDRLSGKIKS